MATIRSSRFDLPLSYDAGDLELRVGDVVRVPLGSRDVFAFVISDPELVESEHPLRAVIERSGTPRAFTHVGLALAAFVSEQYLCTLGEALSSIVLNTAIPRTLDTFVRTVAMPDRQRYPSVPARLVGLIWDELADGFGREQLLRHPDARRTGDRAALLRHLAALVRSGEIRRVRTFVEPRTHEYRIRVLHCTGIPIGGPKARALLDFVRQQPGVPRADALLAGFSNAIIARAIKAGALREDVVAPVRSSSSG
ncbi:MAG: hypothetical protein ACREP1_10715, partial [Rhodanobacteraceae bacterium]